MSIYMLNKGLAVITSSAPGEMFALSIEVDSIFIDFVSYHIANIVAVARIGVVVAASRRV